MFQYCAYKLLLYYKSVTSFISGQLTVINSNVKQQAFSSS